MKWTAAIKSWYEEITNFRYNSDSNTASKVGHYTQVYIVLPDSDKYFSIKWNSTDMFHLS